MLVLNKESDENELKEYFNAILELSKGSKKFTVDLDDVWRLAYANKAIATRALQTEFIESIDYQILSKNVEKSFGRPAKQYKLSVPCLEYFIARKVRAVFNIYSKIFHKVAEQQNALPENYISALKALIVSEEAKEQLKIENSQHKEEIKVLEPKGNFFDKVTQSEDTVDMAKVAKLLNFVGVGRNNLFKYLKSVAILRNNNEPYQSYINTDYFKTVESKYVDGFGNIRVGTKTVIFQKGIDFIMKKLISDGYKQRK